MKGLMKGGRNMHVGIKRLIVQISCQGEYGTGGSGWKGSLRQATGER